MVRFVLGLQHKEVTVRLVVVIDAPFVDWDYRNKDFQELRGLLHTMSEAVNVQKDWRIVIDNNHTFTGREHELDKT